MRRIDGCWGFDEGGRIVGRSGGGVNGGFEVSCWFFDGFNDRARTRDGDAKARNRCGGLRDAKAGDGWERRGWRRRIRGGRSPGRRNIGLGLASFAVKLVHATSLEFGAVGGHVTTMRSKGLLTHTWLVDENMFSSSEFSTVRRRRQPVSSSPRPRKNGGTHRHILHLIRRPTTTTSALVPIFSTEVFVCSPVASASACACAAALVGVFVVSRFRIGAALSSTVDGALTSGFVGGSSNESASNALRVREEGEASPGERGAFLRLKGSEEERSSGDGFGDG
jgi:hypothetical protein